MWSANVHEDINTEACISNGLLDVWHAAQAPCLLSKSLIGEAKVQVCLSIIQQ